MRAIYQYLNCQDYLKSAFEKAQTQDSGITIESYANRVGVGCSTLKMILSGKRKVTAAQALQIAKFQNLSAVETNYLHALCLKDRAKSDSEKTYYQKRTVTLKKEARMQSVPLNGRKLLNDPYALPVLVYLTDFVHEDLSTFPVKVELVQQIAKKFNIEQARAAGIIEVLHKTGIIQKRDDSTEFHYVFSRLTHLIGQKEYLKFWLTETIRRIDTAYEDPRHFFHASVVTIDKERMPEMMQEFRNVVAKYVSLTPESDEVELVQSCIQMLPII